MSVRMTAAGLAVAGAIGWGATHLLPLPSGVRLLVGLPLIPLRWLAHAVEWVFRPRGAGRRNRISGGENPTSLPILLQPFR